MVGGGTSLLEHLSNDLLFVWIKLRVTEPDCFVRQAMYVLAKAQFIIRSNKSSLLVPVPFEL